MLKTSSRILSVSCLAAAFPLAFGASSVPSEREITNVVAFARLFGVVRYFHPADRAASADWDQFAPAGIRRVRSASDDAELKARLQELFLPFAPGLVIDSVLPPPDSFSNPGPVVAWRYLGIPFSWPNAMGIFGSKRTHRATIRGVVAVTQSVSPPQVRGKLIRLTTDVRTTRGDDSGLASFSIEVGLPSGGSDYFDSNPRRIRDATWHHYKLEAHVPEDATKITISLLAAGAVQADFDALDLAAELSATQWTRIPIKDSSFEFSGPADSSGWEVSVARPGQAIFSRVSGDASNGLQFLRISPSSANTDKELFDEAPPAPGKHVDVDLGTGLKARVPLALSDADASEPSLFPTWNPVRETKSLGELDLDERLGDVTVAWNALRHFYPYWIESGVDWDAQLKGQLLNAWNARSRRDHQNVLRRLVADARDGHGRVIDASIESFACPACPLHRNGQGTLPLQFAWVEHRVVIAASATPTLVPVGAVVQSLGAARAVQRFASEKTLVSGSEQWKVVRALQEMATCPKGSTVRLTFDAGKGARSVNVPCDRDGVPLEQRPMKMTQLRSGVWYVDLTRARMSDITPRIEELARASGVIFDMRGYPTDAGTNILRHLLREPEADRWIHIAKIVGPFGDIAGWRDLGYDLTPVEPHLKGRIVFLTDARAISAGDGVMGYVADRKLATIVGSRTAGTNGNMVTCWLPSGFELTFTGVRVTGHDGRTAFHLRGVSPDVSVTPSISGIRRHRDEVLNRAIAMLVP